MNHTKNTRRFAVALAVPVLLLGAAACGSDSGSSGSPNSVQVSGKFGEKPDITAPKGKAPDKLVVKTISQGSGPAVQQGDFVRFDYAGVTTKDKQSLGSSWDQPQQQAKTDSSAPRRQIVLQLNQQGVAQAQQQYNLPPKVLQELVGQKAGSRIVVEGSAKAAVGDNLSPQGSIKPEDGLVWVFDVAGAAAVDAKATAKGTQAAPADGMPEVTADPGKAATFSIPKGQQPPKDLQQQVLIQGKGPEIKTGDALIAQYTGALWDGGKKFDSSWHHGGAFAFQIGTGSVIPGWDKGLVGKHVGDRVLLAIPANQAYGATPPQGIPKNAALVFVVDILGKA